MIISGTIVRACHIRLHTYLDPLLLLRQLFCLRRYIQPLYEGTHIEKRHPLQQLLPVYRCLIENPNDYLMKYLMKYSINVHILEIKGTPAHN